MRFLADECCDSILVEALRSEDHDVLFVMESLRGSSDEALLTRAFTEDRILITEDKDFGELVHRLRRPTHGILLLRFDVADRDAKIPRILELLANESDRLAGSFVVLEVDKVRIRPLRIQNH